MSKIAESDMLRLAMILQNQGQITLEKSLCKLVECILFDSQEIEVSSVKICQEINSRFKLQFDVLEVENAIKNKGKGRIIKSQNKNTYRLNTKVHNQLSVGITPKEQLSNFIKLFNKETNQILDEECFLKLILNYIYYSFNSNASNFINIIGKNPQVRISDDASDFFNPTKSEIDLINNFIAWENDEKNKFFYSIISSSYEYCLITTKKNPTFSKKFLLVNAFS